METIDLPIKKDIRILALGAESAGVFAIYDNGKVFISKNFGDLFSEANFLKYKKAVLYFLKKEKLKPDIILTDLHPLYKTTIFGEELAMKLKVKYVKVQHHIAHIFSAVGDYIILQPTRFAKASARRATYNLQPDFFGIAMDGTGYGLDGNIWGGEIFKISNDKFQMTNQCQNPKSKTIIKKDNLPIERIGSLEDQVMIGGDLAVREPYRMLLSILSKSQIPISKSQINPKSQNSNYKKEFVYDFIKKYYTKNEFELLYNQMEQGFNCQTTTSTGRILDAVSVLLGFAGNEGKYKHEAVKKLEENSSKPYFLKPTIVHSVIASPAQAGRGNPEFIAPFVGLPRHFDDYIETLRNDSRSILQTTPLFEYLIKNIRRDKRQLAATAQLYIAKGLYEIVKPYAIGHLPLAIFAAGGITNNKIISEYLEKQGVYVSKKIPRGDEGIALGQVIYYLLNY